MSDSSSAWPLLSEFSAISGRAATPADVAAGCAVFLLHDAGAPIGEPMDIPLPQYVMHTDAESGVRSPCVLVQAEQARGQQLGGAVVLSDRHLLAGLLFEFELLGTVPPVGT